MFARPWNVRHKPTCQAQSHCYCFKCWGHFKGAAQGSMSHHITFWTTATLTSSHSNSRCSRSADDGLTELYNMSPLNMSLHSTCSMHSLVWVVQGSLHCLEQQILTDSCCYQSHNIITTISFCLNIWLLLSQLSYAICQLWRAGQRTSAEHLFIFNEATVEIQQDHLHRQRLVEKNDSCELILHAAPKEPLCKALNCTNQNVHVE